MKKMKDWFFKKKKRNIFIVCLLTAILSIYTYVEINYYKTMSCAEEGDVTIWRNLLPESSAYDLCISAKTGKPMFKKPRRAFVKMYFDYLPEINFIRKENNLFFLTKYNYDLYMTYGWQTYSRNLKTNEVTGILDFYENSFYGNN